jgi:hypothetical protein
MVKEKVILFYGIRAIGRAYLTHYRRPAMMPDLLKQLQALYPYKYRCKSI